MSRRFVLLGHPVGHSMSPAIHRAAYRELGLPHHYELEDVPDEAALASAIERVRSGEIAGANVTVPWKRQALRLADERAASSSAVGAANVLVRSEHGRVVAHNTDVPALAEEIRRRAPAARRLVVIGNGGAALGAVAAANLLSAESVLVTARRWTASQSAAEFAHGEEFEALGAELLPWPAPPSADDAFALACARADVIVQATSAGMHGAEAGDAVSAIVPWASLPSALLAYDVVYNPPETEFLRAAKAHGLAHAHGLGMLVEQARLAIELWLGTRPPFEPLYAAASEALAARRAK
ncbi:MAG: shikimate dehydrogenase [Polyangiaceae bacterium]